MSMNRFFLISAMFLVAVACNPETEDTNADLRRDMQAIDAYLTSIGIPESQILRDDVSGIRFVFEEFGQGMAPTNGQTVVYDVVGRVISGSTTGVPFINSPTESKKIESVTPEGLNYALRSMMAGTVAQVYIPSRWGYGVNGNTTLGVPGDAVLRYDVELQQVQRTAAQQDQFETDSQTIQNYLEEKNIEATMHESGIWYTVETEGTGATPNPYDAVTFEYELSTLSNPENIVEDGELPNSFIWGLIPGLRIGFQLMQVGDTFVFYLPSGLCYGPNGTGAIPSNANLIFKIKLKAITE